MSKKYCRKCFHSGPNLQNVLLCKKHPIDFLYNKYEYCKVCNPNHDCKKYLNRNIVYILRATCFLTMFVIGWIVGIFI